MKISLIAIGYIDEDSNMQRTDWCALEEIAHAKTMGGRSHDWLLLHRH